MRATTRQHGYGAGILAFLVLALSFAGELHAAPSITVTGSWVESIDKNNLTSGAGSDLASTYTSASGQVTIDVSGAVDSSDNWRVDVKKVDSSWDSQLHPYVVRTSDGSGGSVSGGGSFQEVTDVDATFFSGAGNVTGIQVQLKMTGASVQLDPASYSTAIYYTIVDTP